MEAVDEEFMAGALDFMERAVEQEKPFFTWFNTSRMHVWTHLKPESDGVTGLGLYLDGTVDHDGHVGIKLDKLDELGVADNTSVVNSTDNGAEPWTWLDRGQTRFRGAKGTSWEGGHRVPLIVRWPDSIEPGTIHNDIIGHMGWMPTLAAAAGVPYFRGGEAKGPRDSYLYFGMESNLSAVRYRDFKAHFRYQSGSANALGGSHYTTPTSPLVLNLRAIPVQGHGRVPVLGKALRWISSGCLFHCNRWSRAC